MIFCCLRLMRERTLCRCIQTLMALAVIYRCTFEEYFLFISVYLLVYSFEADIFSSLLFCFSGLTLASIIYIFVSEASIAILLVHGTGLAWRTWARTFFLTKISLSSLRWFSSKNRYTIDPALDAYIDLIFFVLSSTAETRVTKYMHLQK